MSVRRVVPNLTCRDVTATREFYVALCGFDVVMDLGWIVTVASPTNVTAQLSFTTGSPPPVGDDAPVITIEVDDVDAAYERAGVLGAAVTLPLRDEEWGVRRFFVRDPDGRVVNVMAQPGYAG